MNKRIIFSILLTILALIASFFAGIYIFLILAFGGTAVVLSVAAALLLPALALPMIWMWSKRDKIFKIWIALFLIVGLSIGAQEGIEAYKKSKIINTAPNIVTEEYLPFKQNSKIEKLDNAS